MSRSPDTLHSPASALVLARAHSAQDLREAISVSAKGDGQQVEIQLGHMCNNVCGFCVSGQLTQQRVAKRIALEPIIGVLEEARARGVSRVTFLGGEPTIQPSFLPALTKAVELGFPDIVIFTNLVRGREPTFLEKVVALGRFTWRVSIQGGNQEAHDLVVGRTGAFAKIEQGLSWLGERGHDLTANACINEDSYRSAPDYVGLVQRSGIRQLHLDMVRPGSTGVRDEAHMKHLLAKYSDMAGPLGQMLDAFDAWNPDFEVNIGNLPFCVLPHHAHRIAHGGEETLTVTTDDRGELGRIWNKYDYQGADKVHAEACGSCAFRPHCRGVPAGYAALYGTGELRAISEGEIEGLDPRVQRWMETGWRPGRGPSEPSFESEPAVPAPAPRDLARVVRLAKRIQRGGPYGGWRVARVRSTSPSSVAVQLARNGDALGVSIEARPQETPPVKVSFQLPAGVPEQELRGPVEAISLALRRKKGPRPPTRVNHPSKEGEAGRRLELFVASGCNLHCAFCCESDRIQKKAFMPWPELERKLLEAAAAGVDVIQFMGGEATLHPQFPDALKRAKELGMGTYVITNLMRWQRREFAEAVGPWLDEVMISMHAGDAETGHEVTGVRNWWRGFQVAAQNARETLRGRVRASTVLTRHNVDHLEQIAEELLRFEPHAWVMGCAVPVEGTRVPAADLNLTLTDLRGMRDRFVALSARCAARGCKLVFFSIPHCVLGPELWDDSHDLWLGDQDLSDNAPSAPESVTFWPKADDLSIPRPITLARRRSAVCDGCQRAELCGGHFAAYLDLHGDGELKAITDADSAG
ncbi:MAG: radical SAM protein [Deltaproteobacteria bacterium]|nr:radical SAM protein [Deltaproteobacteria bacterium]